MARISDEGCRARPLHDNGMRSHDHHEHRSWNGTHRQIGLIYSPWGKLSGAHFNPSATNVGSALPAHMWKDWRIYFTAPPVGMLAAATYVSWQLRTP